MAIADRYDALIRSLGEKTDQNSIDWAQGASRWIYITSFNRYSVSIEDWEADDTAYKLFTHR